MAGFLLGYVSNINDQPIADLLTHHPDYKGLLDRHTKTCTHSSKGVCQTLKITENYSNYDGVIYNLDTVR